MPKVKHETTDTRAVELYLDTNLEDFESIKTGFVSEFASTLQIPLEDIHLVAILLGCVRVILEIPKDAADKLSSDLNADLIPPELQAFIDKYNIKPRLTNFDYDVPSPFINRLIDLDQELKKDGRVLTWLHISDIHLRNRADQGVEVWLQDRVTDSFLRNLPNLLAYWRLQPNIVFLTGDITFSASAEEYVSARDFIDRLLGKLDSGTRPRLFMVPGNHDVEWNQIQDGDSKTGQKLKDKYTVSDYLTNPKLSRERERDLKRFDNFFSFFSQCADDNLHLPLNQRFYYVHKFAFQDLNIGVAGLNSAWRSTKKQKKKKSNDDPDFHNLLLGDPQLDAAIRGVDDCHVKFALLHHPPESGWFKDFDANSQTARMPKFDFVLRGHEHHSIANKTTPLDSDRGWIHLAAGALYDSSEYQGKTGYPICFNVVRINLDTGTGVVFYWRYFTERDEWRRDLFFEDGFSMFGLPKSLINQVNAPIK